MAVDHKQRAKSAWPILVSLATTKGKPTTYGELAPLLDFHHRVLSYPLGVIQHFCHKNNLPPLQALVVNCKTRLPGGGYNGSAITKENHAEALSKVYSHNWETTPPEF